MSTLFNNIIESNKTLIRKLSRIKDDGTEVAMADAKYTDLFREPTTATGNQSYTSPGTHSWVCPSGVFSVSVCCIGGGGAGQDNWANPAGGGAGLGWKNQIPVVPGQSYTVQVGAGGQSSSSSGDAQMKGGDSYFDSPAVVCGKGGGNTSGAGSYATGTGSKGNSSGGYTGDGGGAGGHASNYQGGGGAAGYTGNGGNGQTAADPSSGGAAGGGYYSSTYGTGAGGGTGINGKGTTGYRWYTPWSGLTTSSGNGGGGEGGSGGSNGGYGENPWSGTAQSSSNIPGGNYGGGGGGPGTSWPSASGSGGDGAVKIHWNVGDTVSWPNP